VASSAARALNFQEAAWVRLRAQAGHDTVASATSSLCRHYLGVGGSRRRADVADLRLAQASVVIGYVPLRWMRAGLLLLCVSGQG
jgi:hypothetical protein